MEFQKENNPMFANEAPSIDEALDYAIQAIDRGDIRLGNAALEWVLQREPDNTIAWIWMACCVSGEEAKRGCYSRIST